MRRSSRYNHGAVGMELRAMTKDQKDAPTDYIRRNDTQRQSSQRGTNNQKHQHAAISISMRSRDRHRSIADFQHPIPTVFKTSAEAFFRTDGILSEIVGMATSELIAS